MTEELLINDAERLRIATIFKGQAAKYPNARICGFYAEDGLSYRELADHLDQNTVLGQIILKDLNISFNREFHGRPLADTITAWENSIAHPLVSDEDRRSIGIHLR